MARGGASAASKSKNADAIASKVGVADVPKVTATGRGKLIEEIADARSETERKLQQAAELEGEALDIINDLGDVSRELAVIHNGTQQQVPEDEAPDEAMRDVRPLVQEAEAQDDRDASQLRQQVEEEEAQVEEGRGVHR